MAWDEFIDLATQEVTITPRPGTSEWGKPQAAGAPVAIPNARVQAVNRLIRNPDGRELQITYRVFVGPDTVVARQDLLTFPDGQQYEIRNVAPVYDEVGLHHKVLEA